MARKAPRRGTSLVLALTLITTMVIAGSVATSTADVVLPDASQIELTLESGTNEFAYGAATQEITTGSSQCRAALASADAIMTATVEATNKTGDLVGAKLGLVEDGLGSSLKGNGNGQECGRVDEGETLTLMLGAGIGSKRIESAIFDFEAKFNAVVKVEYLKSDGTAYEDFDSIALSEGGSDSGPDSKYLDKYEVSAPQNPELAGILFSGVRISTVSGSVSLEGGATWPNPDDHRTVFNLVSVVDCGDGAFAGEPNETDDPDAAFILGPSSKEDVECGVPISITTANNTSTGGKQTVEVAPPSGFSWAGLGVTGLLTIEWDIEDPTDSGIARSEVEIGTGFEVIPWCEDVVNIASSASWYFDLLANDTPDPGDDPLLYRNAVPAGVPLCLVQQTTTNVDFAGDDDFDPGIYTQTTEVFYLFEDPLVRR